jgi:SEC-C motif-containing protein
MSLCPCGSDVEYKECCERYISHAAVAPTAEAVMRSRYSAYVKQSIDYLNDTLAPAEQETFSREETEAWASQSEWLGLKILSTFAGLEDDKEGMVEFVATFKLNGEVQEHHERSMFLKMDSNWYYVCGSTGPAPEGAGEPRLGRSISCPCGSSKKYKKCCGK